MYLGLSGRSRRTRPSLSRAVRGSISRFGRLPVAVVRVALRAAEQVGGGHVGGQAVAALLDSDELASRHHPTHVGLDWVRLHVERTRDLDWRHAVRVLADQPDDRLTLGA